jgi:hypothetical protein
MWKFIKQHGIGFAAGAVAGFAVGSFTDAGAKAKQFILGPPKSATATADNVVTKG